MDADASTDECGVNHNILQLYGDNLQISLDNQSEGHLLFLLILYPEGKHPDQR